MADVIGPFDGGSYYQDFWYLAAPPAPMSAVLGTPAAVSTTGSLALTTSGLSATIGVGNAAVRGAKFSRSSGAVISVPANTNASLSRRDRIVLRRDLAAKTLTPVLVQGTPAASPAAPALTQVDTGVWDLPLFSFLVPPSSGTTLTGVVDERGWFDPAAGCLVAFQTTAARDANLPAPDGGALCTVAGQAQQYVGGAWRPLLPRSGVRNYTPAGPGITSGGNRQSGVGADPYIASFTTYTDCKLRVEAQFRGGANVAGVSAMLIYALIDGSTAATGVMRDGDRSTTIIGWQDVSAGTHTLALRAEAFGGDVTWVNGAIAVTETATE